MVDAVLPALTCFFLGVLLTLWWADGRWEQMVRAQAEDRARWEAERAALVQALVPAVQLAPLERRERRQWSDEEEAAWEKTRAGGMGTELGATDTL